MIIRRPRPAVQLFSLWFILLLSRDVEPYSVSKSPKTWDSASSSVQIPPVFIAHRGDKFLMPEHTIPAYDLAMLTNVDYVEPDLVLTKDGVFVCHHDITLREGTDVSSHPEFAALITHNKTLFLDGENVTIVNDWLISDFTFDQLSKLRINQKQTGWRPQYFNGIYRIPTFQEYLQAVHKDTWRRHTETSKTGECCAGSDNVMGIIPELKHTNYYNEIFNTERFMEDKFIHELGENGYLNNSCVYNGVKIPCSPLVVQCFQVESIIYLRNKTKLNLLTLLDTQNLRYLTYAGLKELANYTNYVGVWKELLYTGTDQEIIYKNVSYSKEEIAELGGFVGPQDLIPYAHSLGIKVGIYTIYHSEEKSWRGCAIECEANSTKEEELKYYLDMGVDAFFVEGLSESLRIRDAWIESQNRVTDYTQRSGGQGVRRNLWIMMLGFLFSCFAYRI